MKIQAYPCGIIYEYNNNFLKGRKLLLSKDKGREKGKLPV
jgi:hypothetical protein